MTTTITAPPDTTPAPPYLRELQAALDQAHEYAPRRVTGRGRIRWSRPATLTMCGCNCATQHAGTTDRCTLAAADQPGGPCEDCAAAIQARKAAAELAAYRSAVAASELDDLDFLAVEEARA